MSLQGHGSNKHGTYKLPIDVVYYSCAYVNYKCEIYNYVTAQHTKRFCDHGLV